MLQALINYFGAQVKFASVPVVAEGNVIISQFSAGQRVAPEKVKSDETALIGAASMSYSPYVLPGMTPTVLKDLRTCLLETF